MTDCQSTKVALVDPERLRWKVGRPSLRKYHTCSLVEKLESVLEFVFF